MSDDDDIDSTEPSNSNDAKVRAPAGHWVPAHKVADHILELTAQGMTLSAIAVASGISPQRVGTIAAGKTANCRSAVAASLLAVTFDPALSTRQAPWSTRRRVGALMAMGWPQTMIAVRAGAKTDHVNLMMRPTRRDRVETIPTVMAEGIKRVYEELKDQDGPRELPKKLARAAEYPPPQAWTVDEMEDPEPSTIARVWKRWSDAHPKRWFERLRDARETAGYSVAEAAAKLDVTAPSIWSWESGQRVPKVKVRARVAKLYNEDEDFLFYDH